MTQSYSGNWLDKYLSQFASLVGLSQSQSSQDPFQLYTQKLVSDHTQGLFQEEELASGTNTPLPAGLDSNDAQTATQLLSSLNTAQSLPQAEAAYLMTMVSAHQQDISNNTQALSTVQNPSLKQVIVDDLPTDNMHLQGAQTSCPCSSSRLPRATTRGPSSERTRKTSAVTPHGRSCTTGPP